MDLIKEYLEKKESEKLINQALTCKSYKNYKGNKDKQNTKTNENLSTLGDSIIKFCLSLYFYELDDNRNISERKKSFESDEFFVTKIAKEYDLIEHINFDRDNEKIPKDYEYKSKNKTVGNVRKNSSYKYIATSLEALMGAIYILEGKKIDGIKETIDSWVKE